MRTTTLAAALLFALAGSIGLAACSGSDTTVVAADAGVDTGVGSVDAAGGTDAPSTQTDAPSDAGTRSYRLSSGGVQLLVSGPDLGFQITPADLATDVDVIEVHQEFYGVPWDAFESGTPVAPEWTAKMNELASAAKSTGKPIFLSISMLNGNRDSLAARTVIQNGKVESEDHWAATCYDFATAPDGSSKKQAYLRYAAWMIDAFAPAYLNLAIEVNLFLEKCAVAAAGVIDVANATYDAAKTKSPSLVAFPSFQIDHLYGYDKSSCPNQADRTHCFDTLYAQVAPMKRDRFAMSTYPSLSVAQKPADLPPDWFSRGAARSSERAVVAETGWDSTALVAQMRDGTCYHVFDYTEADTAAYLDLVLQAARTMPMELVNWWSDRDLIVKDLMTACPCTFDATWCAVLAAFRGPPSDGGTDTQFIGELGLKAFGTMGLRDYTGAAKGAVYSRWQQALAP